MKLFMAALVCLGCVSCHTLPYAVVGAGVGAHDGWTENEGKNVFGRCATMAGCTLGGFFSGGCNGAGNDLKFVRNQRFDYSEMNNPFNKPTAEATPAPPETHSPAAAAGPTTEETAALTL